MGTNPIGAAISYIFFIKATMKKKQIVKTFKENGNGELYIEFSEGELDMLGLEKGDSVEWMQLEDGEVCKKMNKNKWCF